MTVQIEQKREKGYKAFLFLTLMIFFVMYMMTLDIVGLPLYILKSYAPILIFAVIGLGLYRGDYGSCRTYYIGLIFVLWYVITRIVLGDGFLVRSFVTMVDLFLLYGVAFPFAKSSGDAEKRKMLDILSLVYVVFFALAAWIGVYFAITGKSYTMPRSGTVFGIDAFSGRLQILGQNPNPSAILLVIGIFMTVYLMAHNGKCRWLYIPAALSLVGMYTALALTDSRTSIVSLVLAAACACGVLASRIKLASRWLKTAVILLAIAAGLFVSYKGFGISLDCVNHLARESRNSEPSQAVDVGEEIANDIPTMEAREISLDETAFTGRWSVYHSVLPAIKEEPGMLLWGNLDSAIMTKINAHAGHDYLHMHNSYLQVLMLMGIPGLLFALWLTIQLALATLKLWFGRTALSEKLLPMFLIALLVSCLVESYVFVPWSSMCWSLTNFLFLLYSGYTLEAGSQYTFREIFSKNNG